MAAKGYTSENIVEIYMGESFTDLTVPTSVAIASFVLWAEKQIDDYTDTSFTSVLATTQILDSYGHQRFLMPKRPIVAVSSIWVDEAGLGTSANWVLRTEGRDNSNDFILYKEEGAVYFYNDTPGAGKKNVKTTYAYGHTTVPKDVERLATLLVVKEIIKSRIADNIYSSQDSIQVGPITISKAGTQNIIATQDLDKEIAESWKAVGRLRVRLH